MMSRGRAIFTEADVTRALKAAQKAGLPVYKYEIDWTGKIVNFHSHLLQATSITGLGSSASGGRSGLYFDRIPTGAILVVLITVLGPVSGAHFNPAVTLVFASRGEFPWRGVCSAWAA